MNTNETLPKRALILGDDKECNGHLMAIRDRLKSRFGFEVSYETQSPDAAYCALNYDLLVVATRSVPRYLRMLPRPIILLNYASLDCLWMTGPEQEVDFGR